jgi:hypothetical protein
MLDYCMQTETPVSRTTATVPEVAAALTSEAFGFTVEIVSERLAFLFNAHCGTVRLWDNGGEIGAAVVNDTALPVFAPTRFSTEAYAADYGAPIVVAYRLVSQLNGVGSSRVWKETAASLADGL